MLSVVPPAFAAAVFPTLLAGVIVILQFRDPKPLLVAFLLGGWLMSLACGLVIVFALRGAFSTGSVKTGSPAVNLAAGGASVIAALVIWLRRHRGGVPVWRWRRRGERSGSEPDDGDRAPSRLERFLRRGSMPAAFLVGALLNPPGIWYLIALKDIAARNYHPVTVILLLVLFNAVMFVLAEVPLIGFLVSPERTTLQVRAFQRWLLAHLRPVAAGVAMAMGVYLIIKGLVSSS